MTSRGIRQRWLAILPFVLLVVSCSQQDVDQWNAFWATSQPASQPATQVGDEEPLDEMSRLRLQRDRLAAANRNLQQELDLLAASHRNLESRYDSLQTQSRAQAGELEAGDEVAGGQTRGQPRTEGVVRFGGLAQITLPAVPSQRFFRLARPSSW